MVNPRRTFVRRDHNVSGRLLPFTIGCTGGRPTLCHKCQQFDRVPSRLSGPSAAFTTPASGNIRPEADTAKHRSNSAHPRCTQLLRNVTFCERLPRQASKPAALHAVGQPDFSSTARHHGWAADAGNRKPKIRSSPAKLNWRTAASCHSKNSLSGRYLRMDQA